MADGSGLSKPSDKEGEAVVPAEAKTSFHPEAATALELEKMSAIETRKPSEVVEKRRQSELEKRRSSEVDKRRSSEVEKGRSSEVMKKEGKRKSDVKRNQHREKKTSNLKHAGSNLKPSVAFKPMEINMRNLNMFQKMMADRNQAKKEEDAYLKLRKQQLLADLLPKTKGAKIRRSDEKFPSNQLKAMEKWNFGAMKAKYMAIRPSGKYATWFGKNQDEKHKHERCMTIKERIFLMRKIDSKQEIKPEPPPKTLPEVVVPQSNTLEGEGCLTAVTDAERGAEKMEKAVDDDDEIEEDLMSNVRYSRPLNERGIPFWLEEAENENNTDEEEAIVSREAVEKDGQEAFTKIKEDPRGGEFNPGADLKQLAKHDKLFGQHMVYLSTILSVVNLWSQPPDEKENPLPPKTERKVKFSANMTVSEYAAGIENITAHKGVSTATKELKDVVKVADRE